MIPRLPPLILALLGGASIYGIKYALDRFEPKAIGPGKDFERLMYRRNVKRVGVAAGIASLAYAGYTVYGHMNKKEEEFYEDQYSVREKQFVMDKAQLDAERKEKESQRQQELEQEVIAMNDILKKKPSEIITQ
ncbi:hypothetical protein INT47_011727 [Mucor saturninus]|uniref:Uncharacterized protein n=1 Tax=Mucor saturninus TaxID=64648 RepID=A0A8H7V516_9FUNG|nr:hypothetical protein INT47_011727 [Mucor saturninus]